MVKNKGISSFFCLAMLVMLQSNSCTSCSGVPSDFNKVILHATSTDLSAGQSSTITASVPKDSMNEGVTWVFTPQGGVLNAGTFTVNSVTSATYAAPTTLIAAKFTVVIQATSIAFPSEVNTVTITIEPTATLTITTTSLPNGTVGTPYPSTQLAATGGVPPYTWSVATGALPAGLTLTNGTISGTPQGPPGVDNTFTLQVQDSETPTPMTATTTAGQLSITITNLLSGNYAFEFSGFNSTGVVVVAGSFTADGVGTISSGVEDVNSIAGPPKNQTFTGTFTLNGNRGQIVFASLAGTPTYDFAIDSTGAHGRIIEFDATGVRGSGQIEQQTTGANTCGSSTLSGAGPLGANYVIGISGATKVFSGVTPGPIAMVGRFTAEVPANNTTPGNIDTGEVDLQYPQNSVLDSSIFSGTFQTTNQSARCSMSLTQQVSTMNFSVYPVTSVGGLVTEAFVVETDALTAAAPFVTVGKMVQQVGYPFTTPSNSLASPSVGGLDGSVVPSGQSAYLPFVAVAQLNPSGGGAFTMPLFENIGGAVASGVISANLNTGDQFGRVDTSLAGSTTGQIDPVFYVINANEAFGILGNLSTAVLGIFEPQSTGGFSTSTVAATFAEGTATPSTTATTNLSGVVAITSTGTSTGTIAGTQDTSASGANTAGQAVTGTITLSGTGTTDGSGSLALTAPATFTGQFIIISPTKIALISTTTGDLNPVLIYLGNCESTCGED
jgi:Putative Ig domain